MDDPRHPRPRRSPLEPFGARRPEPASLAALLNAYLRASEGAFSPNTERAIRGDLKRYTAWCAARGLNALPAHAATVASFVDSLGGRLAPATVRRHLASIAIAHKAIGAPNPLGHAAVQLALKRMHRRRGRRQHQVKGLTRSLLERMTAHAGDRLIDLRNCAMLCVAYDAMLRRSELLALKVADVTMEPDGSGVVLVRHGKTDPDAVGAVQYLHRDTLERVRAWLAGSRIRDGLLFRAVRKDGRVGDKLDPSRVPRIYRAMAERAGLPPHIVGRLSGHSPRVGAAQDMIAASIATPAILQAGRWKSPAMVQRYGERLFARRSAAAQLARIQNRG